MENKYSQIDSGRLSIIVASILLAYSLTPFVNIPDREINLRLFGFVFLLRVDYTGLVSILSAGLGATGMSWLLQTRQNKQSKGSEIQHLLLPAFTAWAIGVPLGVLEIDLQWWVVFVFGGLLLTSVFIAEFVTEDSLDYRSPLAIIGLTAVGFAIFFTLCVALRGTGLRLYLLLPVVFLTAGVISWRILRLRRPDGSQIHWSVASSIIAAQVAIGLHYLPISPIQFGIILTGFCYASNAIAMLSTINNKNQWFEPGFAAFFSIFLAIIFR